jgi:pimeloyl-ACP methyl ester carboxylesterase
LFWPAPGTVKAPLLVALHTWSGDYRQEGSSRPYWDWCRQEGWHFIHPNFGGPNRTPRALGSEEAVADIVRAVRWAREHAAVDADRIYLIGVSGGGHMALLMAGRHPEIWAGVSAWCGIADVAQWHADCVAEPRFSNYARHIEAALGGLPTATPALRENARRRSPLTWLQHARGLPLDLQAGLQDGRAGSVPFSHSLRAFNAVAGAAGAIPEEQVVRFYESRQSPEPVTRPDPAYGERKPVFQRISGDGQARVTIFDGGHEIVHGVALNWLAAQRRGQPAVWQISQPKTLPVRSDASESGK